MQQRQTPAPPPEGRPLLEVRDLRVSFFTPAGEVRAVSGISYQVDYGEVVGIVGESGSGKSVEAYSIMGLLQPPGRVVGGSITFEGEDVLSFSRRELTAFRGGRAAMIFQNPMTCLNPVYTVGDQLIEALRAHQKTVSRREAAQRAAEMLERVGIHNPERRMRQYPHEFSGGMRQRVMIAMGLICHPKLLIADEPTTALDVTIQAQILTLMNELRESYDTSVIMITHDLGVIAETCEQVAVLYAGQVVEEADVDTIFHHTAHPYTTGLLRSVTSLGGAQKELYAIRGTVPTAGNFSTGCRFADRCDQCMAICREQAPALTEIAPGHQCRCWLHAGAAGEEAAQ